MAVVASFKFLIFLSQFFGIFPFAVVNGEPEPSIRVCPRRLIHTKIVFFVFTSIQIYTIWYVVWVYFARASNTYERVVLVISTITITASILLLFLRLLRGKHELCAWLNRVDDLFPNLTEASSRRIRVFYYRMFVLIFATVFAVLWSDFEYRDYSADNFLLSPLGLMICYYASLGEIKLFLQLFLMFVNILRFYYRETLEAVQIWGERVGERDWLSFLRKVRARDLEVQDLLEFLHRFFMPVVSLQLYWGVSTFLFGVGIGGNVGVPLVTRVLWTVFIFSEFLLLASLCNDAEIMVPISSSVSEKTAHYLHRISIQWDSMEIRKEIDLLSLQFLHRRVEFVALGSSKINLTFMYSIVGWLTSYTVILLQFPKETDNLAARNHSHPTEVNGHTARFII